MSLLPLSVPAVSKCSEVVPTIWQWHPPVGVFIALLAVVGVLVPWFRGQTSPREKAFWTFLMFLFVGLEIRTIYLDQARHDREQALARCQQLARFQRIATELDAAITQSREDFDQTMKRSDSILVGVVDAINISTGGRSFVLINYVPGQLDMAIFRKGKYPLSGVSARIVNLDDYSEDTFNIRDSGNMGGPDVILAPHSLRRATDYLRANIFFKARNGVWIEELRVKKGNDNMWKRALRVRARFTPKMKLTTLCEQVATQIFR